jgi:hypothetical protein
MQQTEINNKKQIEIDELAKCYTQLANSMAMIYGAHENHTPLTKMLDEMAGRINMIRSTRLKSK